ncbi:RNA polymerase sigma factor [Nodosilinea nodulosa]|uniref:RNA polymerase sigma factor n=1 Tax=Nodosilinea nodulosa TaxID=416001 RepID=UPI0002DA63F8|nr:DUF6596 domain-containing protein [Nodosilinea nodulosa]
MDARRAAELAARNSYGRLVAYLAVRSRDVSAAEDALGDAFLAALKTWPSQGLPANPEAWLLVAARRRLIDTNRHARVKAATIPALEQIAEQVAQDLQAAPAMETPFPDERLKLLFLCAHPTIDPGIRTPLMLQTVLGFTATDIASAFLVAPATMGQRLVRAKAKIRDAGIPFELPAIAHLPERLEAVLEAIYAAYNRGWESISGADSPPAELTDEALWLARLCVQLLPQAAEARGLLALMLYCEARHAARRSPEGAYIPLAQQDTALWSMPMVQEAEATLNQASKLKQWGRFQLEAAIQSVHAQRAKGGTTDWAALVQIYSGLVQISPTLGAWVGRAAAIAEAHNPQRGLQALDDLPASPLKTYQPYWALRGHLLAQLQQFDSAKACYSQAIKLSTDAAVRAFLAHQSEEL